MTKQRSPPPIVEKTLEYNLSYEGGDYKPWCRWDRNGGWSTTPLSDGETFFEELAEKGIIKRNQLYRIKVQIRVCKK